MRSLERSPSSDVKLEEISSDLNSAKISTGVKFSSDNCNVRIKIEECIPNDVLLLVPKIEPLNSYLTSQSECGTHHEIKTEFNDLNSDQEKSENNPLENYKCQNTNFDKSANIQFELVVLPNISSKAKLEIEYPDNPIQTKSNQIKVNSKTDCVVPTIDNTRDSKKSSKKSSTRKEHKCPQCNFAFLHYPTLCAHMRQAHCPTAPLLKSSLSEIAKEKHIPHNLENDQQCDICEKVFCSRQYLKLHISTIHEGIRAFACQLCPLRFSMKKKLMEHERIHTGEKPFVCGICGRRFTQRGNMNKHIKRHEQRNKQQIKKIHHLKMHLAAVHNGIRPFACQFCPSTFTQKPHLQAHERTHTDKKHFACDICGLHFSQLKPMKNHRKKHERKSKNEVFNSRERRSQNAPGAGIDEILIPKIVGKTNDEIEIKMEFESYEAELE